MLLRSLISLTEKDAPNWSRDNIREIYNEVQKIILTQKPVAAMRMFDSTTGKDPKITTTAGTYSYDVDTDAGFSDNAWKIIAVYKTSIDDPTDVLTYPASKNISAKFIFKSDPGAQDYYIRAFKLPTEVSSESVQLVIPESYHISHVREGVVGMIEKMDSGRSERWEKFIEVQVPEILAQMNKETGHIDPTPRRGF